ncbi:efflux RND transporter permease subunit [Endozoicomonas acroporae]|uniref:efflux RND transporter permease subunit n=1 Tax=Endozoicomonas acroporae TaxID=1701104 RepID=UPI003D7BCB7D
MLIGTLEDWDDREVSAAEVMGQIRQLMAGIPNVRAIPVMRSTIGGRSEAPMQFVLGGGSFDQLVAWADVIAKQARDNPGLRDVDIDFNQNQPQLEITIDRERAQELGISAEEIGATLETMLGGVTDTTFMERGEEYDVFLRAREDDFTSAVDLASLYVHSHTSVHPLIVMFTVPLGICGALFGLYLSGETLNIFSQLAMIMLIGLSAKNGILIVEFINQLRDQGWTFNEAVLEASALRLRPILMTALTTVVGAIPLLLASGAGSEFRFSIGVVVFAGVTVSSLLTLFVVPAMYSLMARRTTSPDHVSRQLEKLLTQ